MSGAFDEAERFLDRVSYRNRTAGNTLKPGNNGQGNQSILDVLCGPDDATTLSTSAEQLVQRRRKVLDMALKHIRDMHASCDDSSHGSDQTNAVANQRFHKVVGALLDLVVLEGIYPSLSPGVGIPIERRLKSALKGGFTTRPLNKPMGGRSEDERLLTDIVECIYPISQSQRGIASDIQERMSVDLIAAVGELAYSPALDTQTRHRFALFFKYIIDSKSALDLFPQLTALLHPSCPDWFRSALSSYLSLLPLRPDGVRQTINFIAATASADANAPDGGPNPSAGPSVSLEALARVSKLLASVPSTTTPDSWTTALAPQLLDLLDDPIVDNKRIASYIIGTGFLGKRRLGAPGTVGWKLFAGPVIEALDPPLERCPVPERTLKLALDRLSTMIHFYSNPGLTKRLVEPVFLPLWGLQGYALKNRRSAWGNLARQILDMYMKIYATDSRLLLLSDQLLWDGSNSWTFSPGASGGIEIRKRDQGESDVTNVMDIVTTIDGRVDQYSSLLRAAVVTDDQLGKVFTHVSRCWLLGASSTPNLHRPAIDTRDPIQSLVYAKLTQKLLEDYKDRIASSFEGIIQLVDPIFSAFVVQHQDGVKKRSGHSQPSLAGLSEIISEEGEAGDDDQESETTVSAALGLLSTLLTSSDGAVSSTDTDLLDRVANSIKYIAQTPFQDSSLNVTASNVLMLLNLHRETPEPFKVNKDANDNDPVAEDRNKHRKALKLLSDDLAPVRAQGLSALTDLVSKGSPVLDIASTAILLVSLLQDDDEYIYLSAIKTLGLLASRHPKTAVQFLLERYTDPHEDSTLDVRIKAGEALNKTIEHLGQLFVEGVAKMVGESMIAVVSRRGERPKTQRKRERAKRKADKDAEDASSDGEIGEEEADDEEGNINAHAARIVEGWADTGREEDIRIRTSALSILGTAIETNIAGVGATITSAAMDCALAVLKLEKNDERAILRRAAVMVIMSVIRAIDAAEERGQRLGFGFAGENLEEVVIVLRYVEVTDTDEVVVGHTRAVIESLEAWRQKSLLGSSSRSRGILDMGFDRDGPGFGGGTTNVRIEELP